MDKEKLMDLVNTNFNKFQLEIKRFYKEEYVVSLEQQCKKQKEVIDKAIEYINGNKDKYYQDWGQDDSSVDTYLGEYEIKELLDILKEVSE